MSKIEVNQISSQCGSTLTIGQSGDSIQLACGATQSGFGRTGTVDWDTTAKTASFTAVSGNGYFVNTTSGAITVTLPAGSAGSIVSLKDYANTWQTNNVTVTPNGTDKINGNNSDAILNTEDQSITLVYVDSTKGWRAVQDSTSDVSGATYIVATGGTITCCGDYKIHTFTGPGTFTVCSVGNPSGSTTVDYLVVAGGGSGTFSGGGGAGGFRQSFPNPATAGLPVTAQGYPITVGGGGSGTLTPSGCGSTGNSGTPSVFSTITSAGGGYGGIASGCGPVATTGANGGSGGGGGTFRSPGGGLNGGTGNTPPVAPPQGNPGGKGSYDGPSHTAGGGGGGAGAAGSASPGGCSPQPPGTTAGGAGGAGTGTAINPSPSVGTPGPSGPLRYFAGGGGGGTNNVTTPIGGVGGGGNGNTTSPNGSGTSGTTNTGGGGGGNGEGPATGGSGGSGIVIIRYKFQ